MLLEIASVYNGQLRGPVTLTPKAESWPVELLLPVFNDLGLSLPGFEHSTLRLRGIQSYPLHHRRGYFVY